MSILSLPFALSLLGWVAGVFFLTMTALVTFHSYNLLSLILEHHAQRGHRQLRFQDMATDILGPGWGSYLVGPIQFGLCYASVIACILVGGQSLKAKVYLLAVKTKWEHAALPICDYFRSCNAGLVQMSSFHSLRHINLVSQILCLSYSASHCWFHIHRTFQDCIQKDYSVHGSGEHRLFGAMNAISIFPTTFGDGVIPEFYFLVSQFPCCQMKV